MKKQAKYLLTVLPLTLTASSAVFADDPENSYVPGRYCDIVFYCQTTKILDVSLYGEVKNFPNEAFRFAIKDGQLLVPEGRSVLGDGTANWDLTGGYCSEDAPKELQFDRFEASLFGGSRSLKFKANVIQFADTTYYRATRIWFATCDRFN